MKSCLNRKNFFVLSVCMAVLSITTQVANCETYGGGSGTAEAPYLIYTAEQMNAIGTNPGDWDKHFKLMADIDLSEYTGTEFNIIGAAWTGFTGVFDGNNHEILNFTYNSTGEDRIGLFRRVEGENAEIRDLGLVNPNVGGGLRNHVGALIGLLGDDGSLSGCYVHSSSVSGHQMVGGLVGYNHGGTVSDCYSSGTVWGPDTGSSDIGGLVGLNFSTISNCYSTCSVSVMADNYYGWVGGMVGRNTGMVTDCYAKGNVSAGFSYAGGLVGWNEGEISKCYSSGSVESKEMAGGLVGRNCFLGQIKNCYASGNISGSTGAGGLVGFVDSGIISNCYSTGSVSGNSSYPGGLVGYSDGGIVASFWDKQTSGKTTSAGGKGKTTAQMQTESTFTSAGWDFSTPVWQMCDGLCYPRLAWQQGIFIGASPLQLYFNALLDGPNPPNQILSVGNCLTGTLQWALAEGCNWLAVDVDSGTSAAYESNAVNVSVDTTGLPADNYNCILTISDPCAANSPRTVQVSLYVQGPLIEPNTGNIQFTAQLDGPNPDDQSLTISNGGGGILNWAIIYDCQWLQIDSNSGSLTAGQADEIMLSADIAGLAGGNYNCQLTISDPYAENSPQTVQVNLQILTPLIYVNPPAVHFDAQKDGNNPPDQILYVSNSGVGTLNWQISIPNDCNWLNVYPLTGQSEGEGNEVAVSVDCNGFDLGFYNCQLTITGPNALNNPQNVPVILHVYIEGQVHVPAEYSTIQEAIDAAGVWDMIIAEPNTYYENINFNGKNVTLTSIDPNNWGIIAATVIDGDGQGPVITFESDEDPNCHLRGFTITNGSDKGEGAGICINKYTSPTISNCIIAANKGRGIYSFYSWPKINNCIIAGNTAAGIRTAGRYFDTITNCTIVENGAEGIYSYFGRATITNCIIWGNAEPSIADWLIVTFSDVEGGTAGLGNIDKDPCFALPGLWVDITDPNIILEPGEPYGIWLQGDYHLLEGSPCIDAGDPNYVAGPNETDLDGNPRVVDGDGDGNSVVDMGAYEFVPAIEVPMHFTPQALNPGSQGKWLKAHFILPDGYSVEDVDSNIPANINPGGIESDYINVFINEDGFVEIETAFDRSEFCDIITGDTPIEVSVIGSFTNGEYFYGTDTIRIITGNLKYLALLASHWLEADCGAPDWCSGVDLDQNTVVDFVDFALFDSCCIEVIKE